MNDRVEAEWIEEESPVAGTSVALIEKIQAADAEVQIRCAHQYPRSLHIVKQEINTLVTENRDVAESCFFTLPRGGKPIIGPSVRFAEIVASCFGNITYGSMPLEDGNGYVVSRGYCWDQQKNVRVFFDVRRKAVDRNGRSYNADMKLMTSNAASAIAMRNAILKVVPPAIWMPQFQLARKCAVGDVKTMVETRTNAIKAITQLGVPIERIFSTVDAKGEADLDEDKVLMLRTLYRSVKDGDINVDAAFPDPAAEQPKSNKELLNERLANVAPDDRQPVKPTRKPRTKPEPPDLSPPTPEEMAKQPSEASQRHDESQEIKGEIAAYQQRLGFTGDNIRQVNRLLNVVDIDAISVDFLKSVRDHYATLEFLARTLDGMMADEQDKWYKAIGVDSISQLSEKAAKTEAANFAKE